jgi:hypothetical protein
MAGEQSESNKIELSRTSLLENEKQSAADRLLSSAYNWVNDNKVDLAIAGVAAAGLGTAVLARKLLGGAVREEAELVSGSQLTDLLGKPKGYGDRFVAHDDAILGGRIGENPSSNIARLIDSSGSISTSLTEKGDGRMLHLKSMNMTVDGAPVDLKFDMEAIGKGIEPPANIWGNELPAPQHTKVKVLDDSLFGGRIAEKSEPVLVGKPNFSPNAHFENAENPFFIDSAGKRFPDVTLHELPHGRTDVPLLDAHVAQFMKEWRFDTLTAAIEGKIKISPESYDELVRQVRRDTLSQVGIKPFSLL